MCKIGNPRWPVLAMLGLCSIGAAAASFASPPVGSRRPALDLRPSLATLNAADALNAAEKSPSTFPSSRLRQTPGAQEDIRLPQLGSESTQPRARGRAEELVQRAHREGLPLARLWENKSALVSLGLNQKGKPGLWIIQKIH
jgi:hypothetical protein